MMPAGSNIVDIAANCGNCKNFLPDNMDAHSLEFYGGQIGECKILSNDFCCEGHKKADAGAIGGGIVKVKTTFLCRYWSDK